MTNKYGAQRAVIDGHTFDSIKESQRYQELRLLERAEVISDLTLQPKFELLQRFEMADGTKVRAITYKADFMYTENGITVIEDVKSKATARTEAFRMRWKMLQYKFRTSTHFQLRIHI